MSLISIKAENLNQFPAQLLEKSFLSNPELLDINEDILRLTKKVKEDCHLIDEYIELGRLFRKKGECQKAFLIHRNLLVRDDLKREQLARLHGEIGYDYLYSKTKDFGENHFLQSIKLNKDSLYFLEGLYQCYRQNKQLEKSSRILEMICKISPERKKDLSLLFTEMALEETSQNISLAKKHIEHAIELDEESPLAHLTKSQIQSADNKRKDAIETLEKFIEKWPDFTPFALKKIETLYFEMSQYSQYPTSIKKCILKNPKNFYAHQAFGHYLIKIKKIDEALEQFQKALEICPVSIQSLKEMIRLYSDKGDFKSAHQIIENFLTSLPNQHSVSCPLCQNGLLGHSKNCPMCTI